MIVPSPWTNAEQTSRNLHCILYCDNSSFTIFKVLLCFYSTIQQHILSSISITLESLYFWGDFGGC